MRAAASEASWLAVAGRRRACRRRGAGGGVAGAGARARRRRARGPSPLIYPRQTIPLRFDHAVHAARGATCEGCHAARGSLDGVGRQPPARRGGVPRRATRSIARSRPRRRRGAPRARCDACHVGWSGVVAATPEPPRIEIPRPNIKFNHHLHASRGIGCDTCHANVAHEGAGDRGRSPAHGALPRMPRGRDEAADRALWRLPPHASRRAAQGRPGGRRSAGHHPDRQAGPVGVAARLRRAHPRASAPTTRRRAATRATASAVTGAASASTATAASSVRSTSTRRTTSPCTAPTRVATRPTARRATATRPSASAATSAPASRPIRRAGCRDRQPQNPFGTGTGVKSFHPPGWARDPSGGVIATPRPSSHSFQAKRNIRSCVSCHREETCLECHSADPARGVKLPSGLGFSPHGASFAGSASAARSRRATGASASSATRWAPPSSTAAERAVVLVFAAATRI